MPALHEVVKIVILGYRLFGGNHCTANIVLMCLSELLMSTMSCVQGVIRLSGLLMGVGGSVSRPADCMPRVALVDT